MEYQIIYNKVNPIAVVRGKKEAELTLRKYKAAYPDKVWEIKKVGK